MSVIQSDQSNQTRLIHSHLVNTPFLAGLSGKTIDIFARRGQLIKAPKGRIFFLDGDEGNQFYVIVNGWVKLSRATRGGHEAIIDILNKGHLFGMSAAIDGGQYSYRAEAVDDVTLVTLPTTVLNEQLLQSPELSLQMLKYLSRFRRMQTSEIEHRDLQNTSQRVGCFFLRLCHASRTGEYTIRLPFDKTLIALRLGMTPETFSRSLRRLRSDGLIDMAGASITINDIETLSHYACSACSFSFPCHGL